MTSINVQVQSNAGVVLAAPQPISGDYTLKERGVGSLTLTYPPTISASTFQKDGRVVLSYNGIAEGGTWLIRRVQQKLANRERSLVVTCVHANHLLSRRIVAYAAGSAQASKTGHADDLMKAIVRENFTAPTDATRTMSATYGIGSIDDDAGAGPTVTTAFSRQTVLKVLQDLADLSAAQGTYVGFEVRTVGSALTFGTYTQQRGIDRRSGAAGYLYVSPSTGAIASSTYDQNWTDEKTYIYAVGQGTDVSRAIGTATNATATALSPLGRIEDAYQDNGTADTATLDDDAAQQIYAQRAQIRYEAQAQDSPAFIYNRDYAWGDFLTISDFDQIFNCRVDPAHVTWGRDGVRLDNRFIYDSTGAAL